MADFSTLIASIEATIKENGQQAITGDILQDELLQIVNAVNVLKQDTLRDAVFGGVVAAGAVLTPSQPTFYFHVAAAGSAAGTVTINGNSVAIPAGVGLYLLTWDGSTAGKTALYDGSTFPSDVFVATYGSTTYGEVMAANSAGKVVVVKYNSIIYTLTEASSTCIFSALDGSSRINTLWLSAPDAWGAVTKQAETTDNKVTEITESAADVQYPSAKAVKDALDSKADIDGYYGTLTAGAAENLIGRGTVVADIQGIRTSAGTADIGNGSAIIRKLRGASIVWNQQVRNGNFANGTAGWNAGGATLSAVDGILTWTANDATITRNLTTNVTFINGHKYYISFFIKGNADNQVGGAFGAVSGGGSFATENYSTSWKRIAKMATPTTNTANTLYLRPNTAGNDGAVADFRNICIFDLTLMFGEGNEPSTAEEFEAMFPLPYYAYNAGTLVNNTATGLKTVGFNLYNAATGKAVLVGKYSNYPYEYEICGTFTSISFEDYAGNVSTPELYDGRFFNVDRPGVLTVVGGNSTDTLVHLVWSGWRNYGEADYAYEPYWENILALNIPTITGKLNGEGSSVTIFPDGMKSAGDVYDELIVDADGVARTAIKRIGVFDMGELSYAKSDNIGEYYFYITSSSQIISQIKNPLPGVVTQKYGKPIGTSRTILATNDKAIAFYNSNGNVICVRDSAYDNNTVTEFAAAMAGVKLYAELATPLVYTLDEPINMGYRVDDFGTEAKLPVDSATLPSGPLVFDVQYPMNAVDTLRRLPENYISKESFQNFTQALISAGIIASCTMTWDETNQRYTFVVTAPTE